MATSPHITRDASRRSLFERFAESATRAAGRSGAFSLAVAVVLIWAALGPIFHFSEVWQLVINTGTTIVTFLMVFLIQQQQNKDSIAIHLKLNELIASHMEASNRMVAIEDLSDEELAMLHKFYSRLGQLASKEGGVKRTHSLDDADRQHAQKHSRRRPSRSHHARAESAAR
jgi:low affinity Fe/Cu permease